ncbi:hypothetical protein [Vibrio barjaei]|uniref:hypothetical protein n=1 Tax=Vibrio barjaei TaxID=1676683 RepID=UPI0022835C3A|nr:hypothetical protein [Vibrio barjaei]MCY9872303.1 hypothetical protein [Vibrio barjaei]
MDKAILVKQILNNLTKANAIVLAVNEQLNSISSSSSDSEINKCVSEIELMFEKVRHFEAQNQKILMKFGIISGRYYDQFLEKLDGSNAFAVFSPVLQKYKVSIGTCKANMNLLEGVMQARIGFLKGVVDEFNIEVKV